MTRFHDYDAAFAEAAADPIEVTLYGQVWTLPAAMPAAFPLTIQRYIDEGRDPNTDLTRGELLELARTLVPADAVNAWLARGLSIPQLMQIVGDLMVDYGYMVAPDGDAPGEANAPAGATPVSSSNTGRSSNATSNGSTASTSRPQSAPSAGVGS